MRPIGRRAERDKHPAAKLDAPTGTTGLNEETALPFELLAELLQEGRLAVARVTGEDNQVELARNDPGAQHSV